MCSTCQRLALVTHAYILYHNKTEDPNETRCLRKTKRILFRFAPVRPQRTASHKCATWSIATNVKSTRSIRQSVNIKARSHPSSFQAIDLHAIGRFLECGSIVEQCECLIAKHLTLDCVHSVYAWSRQDHGSEFIKRKCVQLCALHLHKVSSTLFSMKYYVSLTAAGTIVKLY